MSPLVKEVVKAKARATTSLKGGYKYEYWIPLSEHTSSGGDVLCRGLYYYIGLESYDSWRNLLSTCSLTTKSFRNPAWQNDVGINIFPTRQVMEAERNLQIKPMGRIGGRD